MSGAKAVIWIAGLLGFAFAAPLEGQTELASFQAGQGGWHLGTLAVGNLDGDSELEIVVPYRDLAGQWFLDAFRWNGQRLPGFPYASGSEEMNVSPTLYDLTGDGRCEILLTRGNSVIALTGGGAVLWSNRVHHANYVPDAGFQAVTGGFYWSENGQWRSHLPSTAVFSSQVSSPMVADFGGDGVLEVVTAWKIDPDSTSSHQDFNPAIREVYGFGDWGTVGETWSGGAVFFDAATGGGAFVYHIHQLVEAGLAAGRAAEGRGLDVYVLNDSDSVVAFDKTQPAGLFGKGMLHRQFGKNARMQSGFYLQGVDVNAADVDGDGLAEVLVPTTQVNPNWEPHETVLDDDGAVLWRQWKEPVTVFHAHGWHNNAAMIPVNPDGDNRIDVLSFTHSHEIAFRYWNGIEFADHGGWPKDFAPFIPTPPVVGDVDGDGSEEIVIGTYHPSQSPSSGALHIFALDGSVKRSVPVPGGIKHIPSLADVNGDGGLDVVFRSLAGRVFVWNFGAVAPGPVSWATHRGNARRDGNLGRSLFAEGTPVILSREGAYNSVRFSWRETLSGVEGHRIFRARRPEGPFYHIATLAAGITNFIDTGLDPGSLYLYEVGAVAGGRTIRSAPFAIACNLNGNLVMNGGFEADDDNRWDKWFTGSVPMPAMRGSEVEAHQGRRSMEIVLESQGSNATISQHAQYGIPDGFIPVSPGVLYSFGGFIKTGGLNRQTRQWFEWTSTKTGHDTNNRPSLPWPDYFTPRGAFAPASEWTYANRVFVLPEGFPNVELRHRYSVDDPVTGRIHLDSLFFRPLPSLDDGRWRHLVSFGSRWRHLAETPPEGWALPEFDDSAWPEGSAKFGAGTGPTNIASALPQRKPAYYFRRHFVLDDARWDDLLLSARCTDDQAGTVYPLRVWINGTEVETSGIEAVSGDGNQEKHFDLTPFIPLLRAGANLVAVRVANGWQPSWDNVAFDVRLLGMPLAPPASSSRLEYVRRNPAGVELAVQAEEGTLWRVESCESLPGAWRHVATVEGSGEPIRVWDNGQNGRPHPFEESSRFYRLIPY